MQRAGSLQGDIRADPITDFHPFNPTTVLSLRLLATPCAHDPAVPELVAPARVLAYGPPLAPRLVRERGVAAADVEPAVLALAPPLREIPEAQPDRALGELGHFTILPKSFTRMEVIA